MRRLSFPAVVVLVVVAAMIGGVSGALASHNFSDVGTGHPFHNEISAVAGAGIALGFEDGTYKPANNVTRQAMAAFFERGVGRAAEGMGAAALVQGQVEVVAAATIESGAAGSGTGFVVVHGNAHANTDTPAACPCPVYLVIEDGIGHTQFEIPSTPNAFGDAANAGSISAVFPISADTTHTFRMTAEVGTQANCCSLVAVEGRLTAIYVPLSGDGDNTLAFEQSCPQDDGYEQNDDRDGATSLYSAAPTIVGGIVCPSDEDWFSLGSVTTTQLIVADVSFANSAGNIDLCVTNQLGSHTVCSTTTGNTELVVVQPTAAGPYYALVYLASDAGAPGNAYQLSARIEDL